MFTGSRGTSPLAVRTQFCIELGDTQFEFTLIWALIGLVPACYAVRKEAPLAPRPLHRKLPTPSTRVKQFW
jgi:hypothetical protein